MGKHQRPRLEDIVILKEPGEESRYPRAFKGRVVGVHADRDDYLVEDSAGRIFPVTGKEIERIETKEERE